MRVIKDQPHGGTPDEWVVIAEVHRAARLAATLLTGRGDEQPGQDDGTGPLLFGRFSFESRYRAFRTWVNGPARQRLGLAPIPGPPPTLRALSHAGHRARLPARRTISHRLFVTVCYRRLPRRLLDRMHHFVDVVLGEGAGVPHLPPGEAGPKRPLPASQQQLGEYAGGQGFRTLLRYGSGSS